MLHLVADVLDVAHHSVALVAHLHGLVFLVQREQLVGALRQAESIDDAVDQECVAIGGQAHHPHDGAVRLLAAVALVVGVAGGVHQDDLVHLLGLVVVAAHPCALELGALGGAWLLLVQRDPRAWVGLRLQDHLVGEPFLPQALARLTAKRIVVAGDHRQLDDFPALGLALEQSAGQVVFVPARHDHHDAPTGLQARHQVVDPPVPCLLAHALAVGILAAAHRVVDHDEVTTSAGHRSAHAHGRVLTAMVGAPAASGRGVGCELHVEQVLELDVVDAVAHPAAEPLSELCCV